MKLSVVVPVHNGGADLEACLAALERSTRKPDEIIVANDGSSDGSAVVAAAHSAKVVAVSGGPRGPAFARNRGVAAASGQLVVFVDADVEVHEDALERFERLFRDRPEIAAAFGSYDDNPPAPGKVSRFKNLFHHYVHQHGAREAETFWAGCGAVRRDVFTSLGGFSESYGRPSIEDIELGVRMREAGHRVLLCPEILCTHRKRWTLVSLVRTDIFCRAVPWTRLILRRGQLPTGLNTDRRSRWSAMMAGLLVLGAGLGLMGGLLGKWTWPLLGGGLCLGGGVGLVVPNRKLYRFFFAHGGAGFGIPAVALHVLYLLYSSAVFVAMLLAERLFGGVQTVEDKTPARSSPLRRHVAGALVFSVLFAVYVGDGDALPGNDATPNVHLAAHLLSTGTVVYTPQTAPSFFVWQIVWGGRSGQGRVRSWDDHSLGPSMRELYQQGALRYPQPGYFLSRTLEKDVYVSSYGLAPGLFALPFVAAVYPFVDDLAGRTSLLWFLCKLASAFAVAGSAWFLFLVAADYLRLRTAVLLTLVYGMGTSVWSVSSQTLWQHAPGEFFLALGMLGLFRGHRWYGHYLAGLAFGLAFMCRPTNSMAVLAGFVVLLGDRRALARYLLAGAPIAALFLLYNLHYFGKWIAFGQVTALAERVQASDASVLWRHSFWKGLAGVLFSPSRGVFIFSPVLLVAVWAAFRVWKERRWLPLRAAVIAALGIWFVTARWRGWWGGWSYGYRLVVDSATILAFVAIPVVEKLSARRGLMILVGALAFWSVTVQATGAFVYDVAGWNARAGYAEVKPGGARERAYFTSREDAAAYCQVRRCSYEPVVMNVDRSTFHARLWSILDNQILYYLTHLRQSRRVRASLLPSFLLSEG